MWRQRRNASATAGIGVPGKMVVSARRRASSENGNDGFL